MSTRVSLGRLSDLPLDRARLVFHPAGVPPKKSLILVHSEAGLRCYWNVCRHLPVPLDSGVGALEPGPSLVCLTHGALYRNSDGLCTSGPCEGESLEPVELAVEGDQIWALV